MPPGDARLNKYFDGLCDKLLASSPEIATSLGLDTGARAGLKSKLSDSSFAAITDDRTLCRDGLKALAAIPDAGLSPTAKLNKAVVTYAFQLGVDAAPFNYGVNTMASAMSEAAGPYGRDADDDPLSGRGNYRILDPEEAIELGNSLGRRGWMMFNPLMAGIDPAEAWKMLRLAEERVFPYLEQ